jgi:hypothetical protein
MPSSRCGPPVELLKLRSSSYRSFAYACSRPRHLRPVEAKSPVNLDGLYLATLVHSLST